MAVIQFEIIRERLFCVYLVQHTRVQHGQQKFQNQVSNLTNQHSNVTWLC
jgi:hypothetical protein